MPQLPKPSDTIKSLNRSNSQVKYMLQFRKKKKTKTKRKKARQQTKKEKKTLSIDDTHSSPHGGREAAVTVELEHGSQVGAQEMDAVPHQLLGSLPQGNRSHSDNLPSGDGGGSGGGRRGERRRHISYRWRGLRITAVKHNMALFRWYYITYREGRTSQRRNKVYISQKRDNVYVYIYIFLRSSLLLSSSTRRRFYPQRSPGQAVVTGVVPSPPRYVPSSLTRIGFSIPTAHRFSSNVANPRSRASR